MSELELPPKAAKKPFPFERDPVIEFYKKDIDRTLIRRSLQLTVEQRIERLMELQRFAEELRRAGTEARRRRKAKRAEESTK